MYREHAANAAVKGVVVCTWEHQSATSSQVRVLPDACVDIIWDGERLSLAGPDTRAVLHEMVPGGHLLGLRFVPGSAGTLLGVPASAVRDAQVDLHELWGDQARRLAERLHAAPTSAAGLRTLEQAVTLRAQGSEPIDPMVRRLVQSLRPCELAAPHVAQLAAAFGVSDRQLRRRCEAAIGYGPKLLARVLRLQAFLHELRQPEETSLAGLAQTLGYADQSHLTHDVTELVGVTPGQLRSELAHRPT